MNNNMRTASEQSGLNAFLTSVYRYMAFGLILTAVVTYILVGPMQTAWLSFVTRHSIIWMVILIAPFFVTFAISRNAMKNPQRSLVWFAVISVLFGFDMAGSIIFVEPRYVLISLATTVIAFLGMSLYGRRTDRDLSRWGRFAIGLLWGGIAATLLNMIFHSSMLAFFLSYAMVAVFLILIAWDTQSLVNLYGTAINAGMPINDFAVITKGLAITGALNLYLDFLNLFLYILQIIVNMNGNDRN